MATKNIHGGGDTGTTALPGGARVPKTHPRIAFFSSADELVCRLGLARLEAGGLKGAGPLLERAQRAVMLAPSACSNPDCAKKLRAEQRFLEGRTAALERQLPPLRRFVIPGSSRCEAALHNARSACRACELKAWALPGHAQTAAYLNRLSSCLFALARLALVK